MIDPVPVGAALSPTLLQLRSRLREAIAGLSAEEMQAHPPSKWSIQQIVEHLLLTYSATESVLAGRLEKGRPTEAKPTALQRCSQIAVLRLGYFPRGRSAPAAVAPTSDLPPCSGEESASAAAQHLERMEQLLRQASSKFGERTRSVSHMILGPLTPEDWRRFHLVHGRHHIRQIHAIRSAHGLKSLRRPADPPHPR